MNSRAGEGWLESFVRMVPFPGGDRLAGAVSRITFFQGRRRFADEGPVVYVRQGNGTMRPPEDLRSLESDSLSRIP